MIAAKYKTEMTKLEQILTYPWHDLNFYSCWLAQSFFYTSRSTRLLLMAAAHAGMDQSVLHRRYAIQHQKKKDTIF